MSIKANLQVVLDSLPKDVMLIAVSKTKTIAEIKEAYDAGQRHFGENRIQEMAEKQTQLPDDIRWHMIGHLQRNKVKYMAEFVHLIHGVDKLKTLKEINKRAKSCGRVIHCLLQAKIAEEDSKFGMSFEDIEKLLQSETYQKLKNIQIDGLMGMATFTGNTSQINKEFEKLHLFYKKLKTLYPQFKTLSMGMSGDYKIAIENGSNMVRIGSAIFGNRS
ncbi:MAG: YggS family pyridoxal phosphate-dependent enzyme [Flavobacteriales bacterium]|nr:MAG: YggS family pyridoxal phosphate-dependent enzyme [Flavobacteriales bacterium]